MAQSTPAATLYFDGACHLCSREIETYRRQDRNHRLEFVDISLPNFDARSVGLDPVQVNKHFHVRLANGVIVTGADAFIEVWKILPQWRVMASLANRPWIRRLMQSSYAVFAEVRPLLPKRKADLCVAGTCAR